MDKKFDLFTQQQDAVKHTLPAPIAIKEENNWQEYCREYETKFNDINQILENIDDKIERLRKKYKQKKTINFNFNEKLINSRSKVS